MFYEKPERYIIEISTRKKSRALFFSSLSPSPASPFSFSFLVFFFLFFSFLSLFFSLLFSGHHPLQQATTSGELAPSRPARAGAPAPAREQPAAHRPRAWVHRLVRRSSPEQFLTGGEKGKRRGEEERKERREEKKERDPGEKKKRERKKRFSFRVLGFSKVKTRLYSVRVFRKNTKSYRFTPIEFTVITLMYPKRHLGLVMVITSSW